MTEFRNRAYNTYKSLEKGLIAIAIPIILIGGIISAFYYEQPYDVMYESLIYSTLLSIIIFSLQIPFLRKIYSHTLSIQEYRDMQNQKTWNQHNKKITLSIVLVLSFTVYLFGVPATFWSVGCGLALTSLYYLVSRRVFFQFDLEKE